MSKVVCIIQAHTTSVRLPNKIFMNLAGKAMLHHVIERVKKAKEVDEIIVATTVQNEDDLIATFCEENKVKYYRGSDQNVLERYSDTVKNFDADIIVRITSDCPLISPEIIDSVIKFFKENNYEYVSPSSDLGLIRGLDTEVFSKAALEKVMNLACEKEHFEHVTLYMYKHPDEFVIGRPNVSEMYKDKEIRLCVDEQDDFDLLNHLYTKFYDGNHIVNLDACLAYIRENESIKKINQNVTQKHC